MWNEFNMKNMGDYRDHYLKKDVLFLANVFEGFIDTCLKFYRLDPCHYFSSPGLSWDTMLKTINMSLRKVVDMDVYLFIIQNRLREGISYIANSISEKSPIGYIFEIDLKYPDKLHALHSDYPLAPEKHAISYAMLSDYCKTIADKYETNVGDVKKLIPNLGSKTNYVVD